MSWNETNLLPVQVLLVASPRWQQSPHLFPPRLQRRHQPRRSSRRTSPITSPKTISPRSCTSTAWAIMAADPRARCSMKRVRLKEPSAVFPKLEFGTARGFFDDLERKSSTRRSQAARPGTTNSTCEYHRGCYTTQSETKKQIRHNEEQLQNAEKFAAVDYLRTGSYPNARFEDIWKRVLFDHVPRHHARLGNRHQLRRCREQPQRRARATAARSSTALSRISPRASIRKARASRWWFTIRSPGNATAPIAIDLHTPPAGQRYEARDSAGQPLLSQVAAQRSGDAGRHS